MMKIHLYAAAIVVVTALGACADRGGQSEHQMSQAATPFYTQMPPSPSNPNVAQAPSTATDSMDPNMNPINP